jgi:hypothetical protein
MSTENQSGPEPKQTETASAGETPLQEVQQPEKISPEATLQKVERMFPFVLRSRILVVGRENLQRQKGHLHFVLITRDLSPGSRKHILETFAHYPIVEAYGSADLEKHFQIRGAKVIGFQKSGLAQSIYAELKDFRVNKPPLSPGSTPKPKE